MREHAAGTYGSDPLQTRGAYEAGLQAQVIAAEQALAAEIGGREAVVFLAPMGAHNAIGFEAWQAVAQWAVVTDDQGVVQAVRDDTPAGDPEHTQPLADLTSRITTAATTDAHATTRVTDRGRVGDLLPHHAQGLRRHHARATGRRPPSPRPNRRRPPPAPTARSIPTPGGPTGSWSRTARVCWPPASTLAGSGHPHLGYAGTAISSWTGVTTGGTPTRVTGLSLPGQSLSGRIPVGLGQLFGLTTLNLKTNSMTGNIPAEPGRRW